MISELYESLCKFIPSKIKIHEKMKEVTNSQWYGYIAPGNCISSTNKGSRFFSFIKPYN